jgi:hypothetical protein
LQQSQGFIARNIQRGRGQILPVIFLRVSQRRLLTVIPVTFERGNIAGGFPDMGMFYA